ncbi:unnamed protein product [Euphydryas editha]|uniref:Uncharacterized protein n=1 Tax=Euphydryas editha TaxID=104508 RepID=A0AAU9TK62_EUPED|nr:unnamed protein product [Euphydryas editha]
MCALAAAALFLAALAALPCKGTDADTSTIPRDEKETSTQPIINKFYQMLHTGSDPHNQAKLLNFNYSLNEPDSFATSNPKHFPSIEKSSDMCCSETTFRHDEAINTNLLNKDSMRNRKRRVVNVIRTDVNYTLSYVQVTTVTPDTGPVVLERRRKPAEAGSSAPLLNYIFDSYSNTHQHRNER